MPNPCWTICTSATRAYASSALKIAGIPIPDVFIVAEDFSRGKPFPDPYLLGAERAGCQAGGLSAMPVRLRSNRVCVNVFYLGIVLEDSPSGIRSGRAAGCKVIALLTTHTREQVEAAEPDFIVKYLSMLYRS